VDIDGIAEIGLTAGGVVGAGFLYERFTLVYPRRSVRRKRFI